MGTVLCAAAHRAHSQHRDASGRHLLQLVVKALDTGRIDCVSARVGENEMYEGGVRLVAHEVGVVQQRVRNDSVYSGHKVG